VILLKIRDIDDVELNIDDKIQLVDENTYEPIGDISSVRLSLTDEGAYEIKAFEKEYSYVRIYEGAFAPLFKIIK